MDPARWTRISGQAWQLAPRGAMRAPAIVYASEPLLRAMDDMVATQLCNVASLPGIVGAACAMPDAHRGYGFPVGGVAAFDADAGGVVSAGGVGFDISCGVRTLHTGLTRERLRGAEGRLADALFDAVPAGVGSTGALRLRPRELDEVLAGGARWAVAQGFGARADLERIEERGCVGDARPDSVSERAKERQLGEMGTLGSGNHYLEVQEVTEIHDAAAARAFGLGAGDVMVTIHCGSRGLGHQIGSEFLARMVECAPGHGIELPDPELACAPIESELGREYLGAMHAAINCALANRQIITELARRVFAEVLADADLSLLYDVSHNTCKVERHRVNGRERRLHVHRKGATRAFGPGHPDLPGPLRDTGQPVLIGGTMGTSSWILAGDRAAGALSFASACHGAGRAMSRTQARKRWRGERVTRELAARGIHVRSPSRRGVAEEAPEAYKDVGAVVDAAEAAGLARKVARLVPVACVKG